MVGAPIANRNRAEIEGVIGFFANTLALRTSLAGDPTFRDLLERVKDSALGAYAHQDMPFERLVEELRPERSLSYNPLFQVLFSLQNATATGVRTQRTATQAAGRRGRYHRKVRHVVLPAGRRGRPHRPNRIQHRLVRRLHHRSHAAPLPEVAGSGARQSGHAHFAVAAADQPKSGSRCWANGTQPRWSILASFACTNCLSSRRKRSPTRWPASLRNDQLTYRRVERAGQPIGPLSEAARRRARTTSRHLRRALARHDGWIVGHPEVWSGVRTARSATIRLSACAWCWTTPRCRCCSRSRLCWRRCPSMRGSNLSRFGLAADRAGEYVEPAEHVANPKTSST